MILRLTIIAFTVYGGLTVYGAALNALAGV